MPYLFTCPNCQTKTLVDDQYSGHVGRCVTCDQPIEVPHFLATTSLPYTAIPQNRPYLGPNSKRLVAAVFGVIFIAGLVGVTYQYASPALARLALSRDRGMTIRNLEQIASALNAYAADHGTYPSPVIRDSNGRPMHSWRVSILPYLNEQDIYSQYNFDEPWDSEQNIVVGNKIPAVFVTPSQSSWAGYQCSYHLVSGDRTLFPPTGPLGPKRVLDDVTKTALVVEAATNTNASPMWTAPYELDIRSMTGTIGTNPGVELGSVTEGGAAIATVDGRGHFLDESTPPEVVLAILTASGGEPLADDVLD